MEQLIKDLLKDTPRGMILTQNQILYVVSQILDVNVFLASYGCDTLTFKKKIFQIIGEKEVITNPPLDSVGRLSDEASFLPPATCLPSVLQSLKKAKKFEIQTRNNPNVSFESFLYHSIKHAAEVSGDTDFIYCLSDSGFQVDRFLSEFEKNSTGPTSPPKPKSVINELCVNLNELAKAGKIDPVVGRDDEILRTIEVLAKRKKNNVVLLGKAGVGKTAIAEGLALAIVEKKVPESIQKAQIYNLEIANMVAGTQYRGQFEEKMMKLLAEFKDLEDKGGMPILFIDEIHSMVGSGNSNGLDFANIIKPALSRGHLRCIGATTESEWLQFINRDKALKRRFDQVVISEPSKEETLKILKGAKKYYEEKHGLTYSDAALSRVVELSVEFITDNALPDKALDLLDYTGSVFKLKGAKTIEPAEVEKSLSRMKLIPLEVISKKVNEVQQPLGPALKANLFGQDHAIDSVVGVVERSLAGLQAEEKPMGSFLFVGPTGTGKTELAKLLAKEMKCNFARIDMSEYMESHSIAKLIGSPPGYVGHEQAGLLQKVLSKNNGKTVLLLDEVEKAHPRIMDIFLQAMDNSKVTDSQGNEIDFKHVLILMSSNLGARESAARKVGFNIDTTPQVNNKAVSDFFSPEFRNRLSGVVHFNALSKELIINIVKKFIKNLNESKLAPKGISLSLDAKAEEWLANVSYDPQMGARPTARKIDEYVTSVITSAILYGPLKAGDKKKIKVSVKDNALTFKYS